MIEGVGVIVREITGTVIFGVCKVKGKNVERWPTLIRNNFPPQIAEQMCNAIDGHERAEHFQRLLREYNEWMQNQQRQQEAVQRFLRKYYH